MHSAGVLALQGDYQKHIDAIIACNCNPIEVRTPNELEECDSLIIPGGESTTLGILLKKSGLDLAIPPKVKEGMPCWGTCMGMILLSSSIENHDQLHFSLLNITVRRNAFGRQVFSFEAPVNVKLFESPVNAVFIRAPIVTNHGPEVEVLGKFDDKIVAVRQGNVWGTSFHPELTSDLRMHKAFLNLE